MKNREQGVVLVGAAILGLLAMAFWAVAYRSTLDCIRVEGYVRVRNERDQGVTRAAAAAAALLRTGTPPEEVREYVVAGEDEGSQHRSTVIYSRGDDDSTWIVTARESSETEIVSLPDLPDTF